MIVSRGGRIEPGYQISKICKSFSKTKFIVAVPRAAKSAATLVALGADEIHMGDLGELGPIDPQLGDMPALGVKRALETIASVTERFPDSAETFARYMSRRITVEQIGYCERVAESAVQYAERLLSKKESLRSRSLKTANHMVYGYKDHGFVIDLEEARLHLGDHWIKSNTVENEFAEKLYHLLDFVGMGLDIVHDKYLSLVGGLDSCLIYKKSDS